MAKRSDDNEEQLGGSPFPRDDSQQFLMPEFQVAAPASREWARSEQWSDAIDSALEKIKSRRSPDPKQIGFTGSRKSGTTTVSIHTAFYFAGYKKCKTLLIDANFVAPKLHHLFEISSPTGLSDVLSRTADWELAVKQSGINRLHVLPIGNTSDRQELSGSFYTDLMRQLETEFDAIVVDLPSPQADLQALFQLDRIVWIQRFDDNTTLRPKQVTVPNSSISISGCILNSVPATAEREPD